MMKEKVMKRLQEHLEIVINHGYSEDRIIGIFLYGSQNYGFATEESDIDSKVFVLPSFEDFCLRHNNLVSKTIELENGEHIDVKDIRLLRDNLFKQNINFMELLFTEYKILMPQWEELFTKWFINNREKYAAMDKYRGVKSITGQAIHTLSQGKGTDNKKFYNGLRLLKFLDMWCGGCPYAECIQPKGDTFVTLWNIKQGKHNLTEEQMIKYSDEIIEYLKAYQNQADSYEKDEEAVALLDKATVEILKASFEEIAPTAALSKTEFFEKLTNLEEQAYHHIISQIGAEGSIVVSKLVKDTTISRPVYNNLLEKMKLNKIADIANMGVKGMYIKIIHPVLKAEASK